MVESLFNRMTEAQESIARKLLHLSSSFFSSGEWKEAKSSSPLEKASAKEREEKKSSGSAITSAMAKETRGREELKASERREEKTVVAESKQDRKESKGEEEEEEREDLWEKILEDLDLPSSSSSYDVQILNYLVKILYMIVCQR